MEQYVCVIHNFSHVDNLFIFSTTKNLGHTNFLLSYVSCGLGMILRDFLWLDFSLNFSTTSKVSHNGAHWVF